MVTHNVLVVEDDPAVSELVRSVLALAGYRPIPLADHAMVGREVDRWQPSCVILDGEIRSTGESRTWLDAAAIHRAHPALPVVMFSADETAVAEARNGRSQRSLDAGFAGVVPKPFAVEEFLATVQSAIERADPPPAATIADGELVLPNAVGMIASGPAEADLLATIVHELRQPLTVIRGHLQLGKRQLDKDPARTRTAIDLSIAQVDRMTHLLGELLDSAAVAANALSLTVTAFDLVGVVVDAIDRQEDGDARRVTFHWPHGPVHVRGDPERVAQILDNLLGNAAKYSPPESAIDLSLTTLGPVVQVRVADHGHGVAPDERAMLFLPFYRTPAARSVPGSGLGLHISNLLAQRLDGRLWLEASSEAGSVFALELPVAGPAAV